MAIYKQGVEQVAAGVDAGIIAEWSGLIANIPAGWVICDGNGGTPNLLTKFIQGVATAATDPGAMGGAATHTLSEAELASHNHPLGLASMSGGQIHDKNRPSGAVNTTVDQTHTGMTATGSDSAHENEPTYYDLAFLMKT